MLIDNNSTELRHRETGEFATGKVCQFVAVKTTNGRLSELWSKLWHEEHQDTRATMRETVPSGEREAIGQSKERITWPNEIRNRQHARTCE